MLGRILNLVSGLCLLGAFVLAGLAVWERLVNLFGYTTLKGYAPSHLLAYASVALMFVIALQLREIGEQKKL